MRDSILKPEVKRAVHRHEEKTAEGCFILEIANDGLDDAVSIARARVEPGGSTKWHRLRETSERYVIVSGAGRVELQGLAPADAGAGDVVRIPPDTLQRIKNTGEEDLIFYCICSPRFQPENYEEVDVG